MKLFYYVSLRYYWTAICKISAKMAGKFQKQKLFVTILDKALTKRAIVLGKESVYAMNKIHKWQLLAKRLIITLHENEKFLPKSK